MMTVISKNVARGDFIIHRGSAESLCVMCEEDKRDGKNFVPIDMSGWSATFELITPHVAEKDVIYSQACRCSRYGAVIADIPSDAVDDFDYDFTNTGEWRIFGTPPSGDRELLGWGYYQII